MPVLAEVSDAVAVLGAVGTFVAVVGGALAGWWLKIKQQNANTAMQVKRADTADDRRQRKDEIAELYRIIDIKDKDHADNRQQIHDLNDRVGVLSNKLNAAEIKLSGTEARLAVCEEDRVELRRRIEALEHRAGE
jgi:chromosome segregation ATPase